MKDNQYVTVEGNKVFLWFGHPVFSSSSKIDATMVFNIGLAMARGEFEKIEVDSALTSEKE